ncbi:IPTL-CTERM sorting domain-containing protein [Brevundimonas guildfordensis]|uniref:IPTL-CTERM sorting domain-containing protein n=1 Tax=Brevundimonas guildfordensis TaxID=2762241 RepID=A0ABR8R3V8_9CAUL|nr:IPTL-CTERM sorting domain-containing protein [Brevundimonas guildfordensis]MBD7942426.1 IPTL-CTERM sorting domain-containing protein [Brevundimonas guildfordensis]
MKTFWATAIVGATLAFSHAALADTYSLTPVPSQYWSIGWEGVSPMCSDLDVLRAQFSQTIVTTVDGGPRTLTFDYLSSYADLDKLVIYASFAEAPDMGDRDITSMTVGGRSFLTCDGNTFPLPGYIAPTPAPVPTLSEWAMIMLGVVLAGGAALTIHRRRAHS